MSAFAFALVSLCDHTHNISNSKFLHLRCKNKFIQPFSNVLWRGVSCSEYAQYSRRSPHFSVLLNEL